jgi:methionine biosynthesis protein MetW
MKRNKNKIRKFFEYLLKPIPLENNFKNYNQYWRYRGFIAPSLNRAKIISKHITKNKAILDIGCGDGTMIEYLTNNNHPKKMIGLDISDYAVKYVRKKGYDARAIDMQSKDFENFLKSFSFDYIIITEVLEHLQEPENVIEVIKKHNHDSTIFISIPNSGFILHRLRLLFGKFPLVMIQENIKEHIRFWTHSDFVYWVNFFGYDIKDIYVSSTTKKFDLFLGKLIPSLFAEQIIYKIKQKISKESRCQKNH